MIELSDGEIELEVPQKATGAEAIVPAVAEHSKPDPPSAATALAKKSTIIADVEEASMKLEFSGSFELEYRYSLKALGHNPNP